MIVLECCPFCRYTLYWHTTSTVLYLYVLQQLVDMIRNHVNKSADVNLVPCYDDLVQWTAFMCPMYNM